MNLIVLCHIFMTCTKEDNSSTATANLLSCLHHSAGTKIGSQALAPGLYPLQPALMDALPCLAKVFPKGQAGRGRAQRGSACLDRPIHRRDTGMLLEGISYSSLCSKADQDPCSSKIVKETIRGVSKLRSLRAYFWNVTD